VSQPKLRILYSKGVDIQEIDAALKGAKRFSEFGLMCEHALVGRKRKESYPARDVYAGEKIVKLIYSDGPLLRASDLNSETFIGARRTKSVFGLGITNRLILQTPESESGKPYESIEIACPGRSGIFSVFRLRTFPDQEHLRAMEILGTRMIGRIFGRNERCEDPECIMGGFTDANDFLYRFVRQPRDLCILCAQTISVFISSIGRQD